MSCVKGMIIIFFLFFCHFLASFLNLSFTAGTIRGKVKSFLHELPLCGRDLKGDGNCRAEGMTSGVLNMSLLL